MGDGRKPLGGAAPDRMRRVRWALAKTTGCHPAGLNGGSDQTHLLVETPPTLSVSSLVNRLRGAVPSDAEKGVPPVDKYVGTREKPSSKTGLYPGTEVISALAPCP